MRFETHKDLIKAIHFTLERSEISQIKYPEFFVSGGSLVDVEMKNSINDIDIYFRNQDEFNRFECIMNDLCSSSQIKHTFFGSKNIQCSEIVSVTQNAITYRVKEFRGYPEMKIQIIRTKFGDPKDIINSHDLSVTRRYLDRNGDLHECKGYSRNLSVSFDSLSDQSLRRLFKYQSKGFELSVSLVRETIEEISKRDLLYSYYESSNVPSDNVIFNSMELLDKSTFTCLEKLELIKFVRDIFQKQYGNEFIIDGINRHQLSGRIEIIDSLLDVLYRSEISPQDLIREIGEDLALELILYRNKYVTYQLDTSALERIIRSKFPEHFI